MQILLADVCYMLCPTFKDFSEHGELLRKTQEGRPFLLPR